MSIEISQMQFSTLSLSQVTKKLHTEYHSCFKVLDVVRTSQILKMNGKTPREKIKKSV